MEYPKDIDWLWLASDRVGNVAAFITAGSGPIPASVLNGGAEDTEDALYQLPKISVACLSTDVPRPDSFIELAERGLFVYDWTDVHRTARDARNAYERVASPTTPIAANLVLQEIGDQRISIAFPQVVFSDSNYLDVQRAESK